MKGDDAVVAGAFRNKLRAATAKVIPEKVKAAIHGAKMKPGSDGK